MTLIDIALSQMRVTLRSYGAAIDSVEVPDAQGQLGHVHLRLPTPCDYLDRALNPHLGATVGRYANRIAGGCFTVDGVTYDLDVNNGPNTLHGGATGWDRHNWTVDSVADDGDTVTVEFSLVSPSGDMGFPGTVHATSTYVVSPGRIEMHYTATTDAPTVVSMTNHGYWNLDDSMSIADQVLLVPADRRLDNDATGIPTAIVPVNGTPFDLREPQLLGPVIADTGGIDHCYLPDGDGLREMGTLHSPTTGRTLRVLSDAPGVQVYTGNNLRAPFAVHQSVSLEAQRLPDAPNQPALGQCILRPGETYTSTTVLEFTQAPNPERI